jgi:hypothetical protein
MLEPVQPPAPFVVYLPPFDFQECIRRQATNPQSCSKHWNNLIRIYLVDQLLCTANALEGPSGQTNIFIVGIYYIFVHFVILFLQYGRRQDLMERASQFSRSVCETFAFAPSETVSIASGNQLMRSVGNDDFNPLDIPYRTFPAMSTAVLQAMLPGASGEVHVVSFHEGRLLIFYLP